MERMRLERGREDSERMPQRWRIHLSPFVNYAFAAGLVGAVFVTAKETLPSRLWTTQQTTAESIKAQGDSVMNVLANIEAQWAEIQKADALQQLKAQLPALLESGADDFVAALKKLATELSHDELKMVEGISDPWYVFATRFPERFLQEWEAFNFATRAELSLSDTLRYAMLAAKLSDISVVSRWLYEQGGHEYIARALVDETVDDQLKQTVQELKLETYPMPDEVAMIIAEETNDERQARMLQRLTGDLDGFMGELQERVNEDLPLVWEEFLRKYPDRFLQQLEQFGLSGVPKLERVARAFDCADLITISKWLHTGNNLDSLAESLDQDPVADSAEKRILKNHVVDVWKHFPDPEVATLISAFYLKHYGMAVEWMAVAADAEEFVLADALLKKYPVISQWVTGRTDHDEAGNIMFALAKLRFREDTSGEELKYFPTRDFSADLANWAKQYGATNVYLLARETVLIARDLLLRKVDLSDEVAVPLQIQESIERIEAGRKEASMHDWLAGDVAVLISGDIVSHKLSGQPVYDLEDQTALTTLERMYKERHKNEAAAFTYLRVPSDVDGKVTLEDVKSAKTSSLFYLGSGGPPRTVIIETHGSRKAVSLFSGPQRSDTLATTQLIVSDFVAAYKQRLSNAEVAQQYAAGQRDTFVFTQCLSFNFAHNLFQALQAEGLPLPVIVASADKNSDAIYRSAKVSYSGSELHFAQHLVKQVDPFGLSGAVRNAHVIDSIDAAPVVVFVPDKNNRPLQVTEVEENTEEIKRKT